MPRCDRFGEAVWRPATLDRITRILKNPAYAGAFVYGRTRSCHTLYPNGKLITEPLSDGGVEDRCEGQVPGLHRLGELRADPGDAARQPRGVRPEQDARRAPRRRRAAPGHRLVRAVRPQDGRAVQGQQPLHLQLPASLPGRAGLPAPSRRPDRRAGGGRVLRGGDAGRVGGLERAHDARRQADEALDRAEAQQVERLRYQALLAERQFNKVDPDNRIVAGELEHRWELALRELRQAEDALARHRAERAAPETLSTEDRERLPRARPAAAGPLAAAGHDPGAQEGAAAQPDRQSRAAAGGARSHQRAHRLARRRGLRARGRAVAVYTHRVLARGAEMEARLLDLARQGVDDATIAALLTARGIARPAAAMFPWKRCAISDSHHRVLRDWRPTHPWHIPGWLTMAELARRLQVSRDWIERRIRNGTIAIVRDADTRRFLFPDTDDTLASFEELKAGAVDHLDCTQSTNQ